MLEEIKQKILENNKKIEKLKEDNRNLELDFSKELIIGKKVSCYYYSKKDKIPGIIKGILLNENENNLDIKIEITDEEDDKVIKFFKILEVTDY